MSFNPELCRNESEVESKLIVSYLLPKLGYPSETWHQEVSFGTIRLDFLAFATQVLPFVLDANSPLSVIMEAKSPKQNLERHSQKFRRYLTSLNVRYGLLTNGKEIRIYERIKEEIHLVFQCQGQEIDTKINEIKVIIGRESLKPRQISASALAVTAPQPTCNQSDEKVRSLQLNQISSQPIIFNKNSEIQRKPIVKIIAVYHNKGGVGKTTTVVNLAAALRKKGKRVLVIDLDSQANTTFATGLIKFDDEEFDNLKDNNIRHVLQSEDFYSIQEVAKPSQFNNPEIDIVPSHISLMQYENELSQLDYSKLMLVQKLKNVEDKYDIVIIDTPPSLNLYARIALITADYLIIPSDLKPFANQGLLNVKDFVKKTNEFRKFINKQPIEILGVLACKISTNARFREYTLPKHIEVVPKRYNLKVMKTVIYQREELSKCLEQNQDVGEIQIPDPKSVFDYQPDGESAREFEYLAKEVLKGIGIA